MISVWRPSDVAIAARLVDAGFSYSEVGATSDVGARLPESLVGRYDVDHHEFEVGEGRALFERARTALLEWRHFEIPWLSLHGVQGPVAQGQVVATLTSVLGLWFLNPCRVVFTHPSAGSLDAAAFAYGTLPGHAECGEERFVVSYDPSTERVHYQIAAFSRPASVLARLGYARARRLQRHFAVSSAKALTRAVA